MNRFIRYAASSAACFVVATIVTSANATSIAGHRAFYEMRMGTIDDNAPVQSVSGRSAFVLEKECSGWRSAEDYMIEFGSAEGRVDRILSHFESWESANGDQYSFDIAEKSSFQEDKDFGGYAELKADGGAATFLLEPDDSVVLPENTYFPMQHVRTIIEMAGDGEKILSAPVFTGAEPDDALMTTNTIIGGWRGVESEVDLGALDVDGFWPVQVAYFKPTATAVEPEYEIQFWLQPNGVVRQYEIDYGDFSIIAQLVNIETIDAPQCQ
jgi:hypothetical protein